MGKQELISEISTIAGIPDPGRGAGSSVYKALFTGACERVGLDSRGSMPVLAQRIVSAANLPYRADHFDSRLTESGGGSTVTLEGLTAIRDALQRLVR